MGSIIRNLLIFSLVLMNCANIVWAGEAEDIAIIKARLGKIVPQSDVGSIKPTALPGIYEVAYGAEVFYFSADGRYVLQGALVDLDTNENLTETARTGYRNSLLKDLDESKMIVFAPKKPRHTLTVFTDIDCGYCRKLHSEMDQINSYGITVRYMMFPRSGVNTPSYQKAVNVWCSKNQQESMTKAKAGESVPQASCENPVDSQMLIGQKMGVNGTPALLLDDGTLLPGYRPAKELADMLDSSSQAN